MADDIENNFNNSHVDEPSDESQTEQHELEQNSYEQNNPDPKIANIIQQLQKSGALLKKKPVDNHHCYTCTINFNCIEKFHSHLIDHVVLPSIVLKRVDDDDFYMNDDDEWLSDPEKSSEYNTGSPITISQGPNVIKIGGVTVKSNKANSSPLPITSLKGISNLLIKKISNVPAFANEPKEEFFDYDTKINSPSGTKSSGTLKLKIKHSDKIFHVVNGSDTDRKTEELLPNEGKSFEKTQNDSAKTAVQSTNAEDKDNEKLTDEVENAPDNDSMFEEHEEKKVVVDDYIKTSIKKEPQFQNDEPNGTIIMNAKVKTESQPESDATSSCDNSENQLKVKSFANESKQEPSDSIVVPKPLLIPKAENNVIEINCDSDKEDDEIIFISSSSTQDKKPPVGLPSNLELKSKEASSTTSTVIHSDKLSSPVISQSVINTSNMPSVSVSASTEKQHSFNWNAPSKSNEPWENMLIDKNNDTLLENILSSHRKDGMSEFGTSEYISLDKLGPQHTCDVCNVKFTSVSTLDEHKKTTGHSNQLVMPKNASNSLQSYQQPGLLNDLNLLPMKQLAETVGKIAGVKTSSAPFTHQQNIMVNIQSFPGGMNQPMGVQPQTVPTNYNYPGMHPMPNNYQGFRMPHPNAAPQYSNHYQMGSQQSYPIGTYPQYVPPSPQNMYNQQMNTQPNHNFTSQPYQPNYVSQPNMHYPSAPPPVQVQAQPVNQMQPLPPPAQVIIPMSNNSESIPVNHQPNPVETIKAPTGGIKIQSIQTVNSSVLKSAMNAPKGPGIKEIRSALPGKGTRIARGGGGSFRQIRPTIRPGMQVGLSIRSGGMRPMPTRGVKRSGPSNGTLGSPKKRMEMLLPDRHDNEDCQVVSLQHQRDGLPLIQSVQGSRERNTPNVQLNSQLTVTKTKVKAPSPPPSAKDANAVANILASRGIKITQKSKTPPPTINIPNLGSSISVTPAKTIQSNFSLPENDFPCSLCNKVFSTNSNLTMHMAQMHPTQKMFRCDSCPISYPSAIQLQEHRLAFHNVPNSELGIPVIDLSQIGTLRKLCNLGITNFIPLANREQGGGCFGIPIVSAANALSGNITNSLLSLGANGILSFGPVKPLPKC